MLTEAEYFGPWIKHRDVTPRRLANARGFLVKVNALKAEAERDGVVFKKNPATKSVVSGTQYGGFRPQDCPQGSPGSSHKEGTGIDFFDPDGLIDKWCMANFDKLAAHGIYIEHPDATPTWSHWTTRAPKSGKRAFYP